MEVVVAAGLVGALFLVTLPLLSQVRLVRQQVENQMIAGEETANVMEAVALLARRGELTDESLSALTLSPASQRLPDATLELELAAAADPFSGRRVTARVSWEADVGQQATAVTLTAWFPAEEGD